MYEHILYEVDDGVATITLDVPERRNATTVPMIHELIDAIDRLDADPGVRCAQHGARSRRSPFHCSSWPSPCQRGRSR